MKKEWVQWVLRRIKIFSWFPLKGVFNSSTSFSGTKIFSDSAVRVEGSLQEIGNKRSDWFNFIAERKLEWRFFWEDKRSKGDEIVLVRGNAFSVRGSLQGFLSGLKGEWYFTLEFVAKAAMTRATFLREEGTASFK